MTENIKMVYELRDSLAKQIENPSSSETFPDHIWKYLPSQQELKAVCDSILELSEAVRKLENNPTKFPRLMKDE